MRAKWISQGLVFVASLLFLGSMASATPLAPGFIDLRGDIDPDTLPSLTVPQSFTVAGQLVAVDFPATTRIFDVLGVPQASMLPVISPGVTVHVRARKVVGGLLAIEIREEAPLEVQDVVLTGAIDAIDPSIESFMMGGIEILTNTNTEVLKAGAPVQFSNLAVGMIVEVDGSTQADQPFAAFTIKIRTSTDRRKLAVQANLEGIGDTFVNEMGRRIGLRGKTLIVGRRNKLLSFGELHLGDHVHVQAVEQRGNVLASSKLIAPGLVARRARRLAARITRKTSRTIKVGRKLFMMPLTTRVKDSSGKVIGTSGLRRGMAVAVEFVAVDGVRVARLIQRR